MRTAGSSRTGMPQVLLAVLVFLIMIQPSAAPGTVQETRDSIAGAETVTNNLLAYKPVEYVFSPSEHGIYTILITGKESEYNIPIKIEMLKSSYTLVATPPPGKVYRSVNIFADTKNIKEALIRFKVKNSWITSNGIDYHDMRMFRWDGGKWVELDTVKKSIDTDFSYYEAKTYGFSVFVISGLTEAQAAVKAASGESSKQQEQGNWLPFVLIILLIGALVLRRRKKEKAPAVIAPVIMPAEPEKKPSRHDLNVTSAFGYRGATILYKVRIENSTASPVADIKVSLFVPDVFMLLEKEKSIALLKPGESKTASFEIRPTGECGDCEVSGRVTYYDTGSNRTKEMDIGTKMLSIICPMLRIKEINEPDWHSMVSNLLQTEENTKEIDMPAETLFSMVSRIIKDMHMHMLEPEVTQSPQIFNGVARFYGEGVKGLKYAAQAEVVGGTRKSKLILRAWAEKEDALTGFYHGILDEIEKRINVKGYIDEPIVQHFNITGHYVTGQVGRIIDIGDRSVQR